MRETPDELCGHVDVRRHRVVVEHDRQRDRLADRGVVAEDLVLRRRVVVRREDHQPVGAELLRLAAVADGARRRSVHRSHEDRDSAGDVLDRRPDEKRPLLVGDRQELAGRAEDDDPRDAHLQLPVEESLPGFDVDGGPVRGERRDRDGVAASKRLAHVQTAIDCSPCERRRS
jgi:hypothetical protein